MPSIPGERLRPPRRALRNHASGTGIGEGDEAGVGQGSGGDVKILQGLGGGLNDRAARAVRQWRFFRARRQGTPVDVIVEVAVGFKSRQP